MDNKLQYKSRRHGQAWIVPQDQAIEFFSGPIQWQKLFDACLKERKLEEKKNEEDARRRR